MHANTHTHILSPLPSLDEIASLPLAHAGRYELWEDEIRTLRSRIYSLNQNNVAGRRYRTSKLPILVPGTRGKSKKGYADMHKYLLLVWRVK